MMPLKSQLYFYSEKIQELAVRSSLVISYILIILAYMLVIDSNIHVLSVIYYSRMEVLWLVEGT